MKLPVLCPPRPAPPPGPARQCGELPLPAPGGRLPMAPPESLRLVAKPPLQRHVRALRALAESLRAAGR